uniref:Uncharacterized protein n=1 Tax=Anopheles culicifacies TaxID=139723 RepID=A0A182LY07_9DIPT
MWSFRLESVLIGNIVDGVHLSIVGSERVRSTNDKGRILVVKLFQLCLLLSLYAIARVELEVVSIDSIVIVVVLQHLSILFLGTGPWCCVTNCQQAGEKQDNDGGLHINGRQLDHRDVRALFLRDVRSFRLESILVRNIVDGVHLSIGSSKGERSTYGQCRCLTDVLELACFLGRNSVARFILIAVPVDTVNAVVVLERFGILVRNRNGNRDHNAQSHKNQCTLHLHC